MWKIEAWLFWGLVMIAQAQVVPLDEASRIGSVEFLIVDSFGNPIDQPTVTVQGERGVAVQGVLLGANQMKLRYGAYTLTVAKSGFESAIRLLIVAEPYQSMIISLVVSAIEKPDQGAVVLGRILDFEKRPQCRWVRMVPTFACHKAYDAVVSKSGLFRIEDIKPGTYAAVLVSPDGLCTFSQVTVLFRALQSITLQAQP